MSNTVKIRQLGIGSRFVLPGYSPERKAGDPPSTDDLVWEVIGRAKETGGNTPDEKTYTVHARHVNKKDQTKSDFSPRYFDYNMEVIEVARGRKTVFAIDRRDQPEDVETIDDIAAREGVSLPEVG